MGKRFIVVEHYNFGSADASNSDFANTMSMSRAVEIMDGLRTLYPEDGYSHLSWSIREES